MDNSKSESNVKHGEWVVVRYIFRVMYGRKFVDVMDDESV
jgi:hypothetical protein